MYNIVNKNKDSTVPVFKLDILISFPVKTIRKDEKRYYMDMLQYSQDHLMLFPYHLSDIIVKGLRVTPFVYYTNMMSDIMTQEKSYDSLPNFTAADCKFRSKVNLKA